MVRKTINFIKAIAAIAIFLAALVWLVTHLLRGNSYSPMPTSLIAPNFHADPPR